MRRFESVVMSETEPVSPGTLWLRPKKNTLDKNGPSQFDIWYFSEVGWRPIADYDSRYNFTVGYNPVASDGSFVITTSINPEVGTVLNNFTFSVYDGTRVMQNSSNFVLESGLKKEIDTLRNYIDNEIARVDGRIDALSSSIDILQTFVSNQLHNVEGRMNTLSSDLNTISSSVSSNTDRIAMAEDRLSLLES